MISNKNISNLSLQKMWDKFNKMNDVILILLSTNWVKQEDGTFTNTIPYAGFSSEEVFEIDLYDDGNLSNTKITEYEEYITEFNINDGEMVVVAKTAPTQTINIIVKGQFVADSVTIGNLEQIENKINNSVVFPIGFIYMSVDSTNPSNLFGGTWEQIKDTFLLAAGNTYAGGSTGGEASHTHEYGLQYGAYYGEISIENNSNAGILNYSKDGNITLNNGSNYGNNVDARVNGSTTATSTTMNMNIKRATANASYTSNLPPYLTVYMWKRIA